MVFSQEVPQANHHRHICLWKAEILGMPSPNRPWKRSVGANRQFTTQLTTELNSHTAAFLSNQLASQFGSSRNQLLDQCDSGNLMRSQFAYIFVLNVSRKWVWFSSRAALSDMCCITHSALCIQWQASKAPIQGALLGVVADTSPQSTV